MDDQDKLIEDKENPKKPKPRTQSEPNFPRNVPSRAPSPTAPGSPVSEDKDLARHEVTISAQLEADVHQACNIMFPTELHPYKYVSALLLLDQPVDLASTRTPIWSYWKPLGALLRLSYGFQVRSNPLPAGHVPSAANVESTIRDFVKVPDNSLKIVVCTKSYAGLLHWDEVIPRLKTVCHNDLLLLIDSRYPREILNTWKDNTDSGEHVIELICHGQYPHDTIPEEPTLAEALTDALEMLLSRLHNRAALAPLTTGFLFNAILDRYQRCCGRICLRHEDAPFHTVLRHATSASRAIQINPRVGHRVPCPGCQTVKPYYGLTMRLFENTPWLSLDVTIDPTDQPKYACPLFPQCGLHDFPLGIFRGLTTDQGKPLVRAIVPASLAAYMRLGPAVTPRGYERHLRKLPGLSLFEWSELNNPYDKCVTRAADLNQGVAKDLEAKKREDHLQSPQLRGEPGAEEAKVMPPYREMLADLQTDYLSTMRYLETTEEKIRGLTERVKKDYLSVVLYVKTIEEKINQVKERAEKGYRSVEHQG